MVLLLMIMKRNILSSFTMIVFVYFVYQVIFPHVKLYTFKCPSKASWNIRARIKCKSTLTYFCLYNNFKRVYVEGCNGPDWDRKGSKRIFSGSFTRGRCIQQRFQPFKFWTNGIMSDCVYTKSICSEEGQLVYQEDSSKCDRTCQCDYKKNYAFIKSPENMLYCKPTEEDCSCYIKSCGGKSTLSREYICIQNGSKVINTCTETSKLEKVHIERNRLWLNETVTAGFYVACLSHKKRRENQQQQKKTPYR